MRFILILLFVYSFQIFASADLLIQNNSEKISNTLVETKTKELKLDDPFLVQFYSKWKSQINVSFEVNNWAQLIVDHEFEKAAHMISVLKSNNKFNDVISATEVYLYWKLGLYHTFVRSWINLASSTNFLKTDLAIAIDQIVNVDKFNWVLDKGIYLNEDQKLKLSKVNNDHSQLLNTLNALVALRSKGKALQWITKVNSPILKFHLAQTTLIESAKNGKLSDAARILKSVYEPTLEKSVNIEKISSYYLLLARLLYQAGVLDASSNYYLSIPQKSNLFLQARVENLWVLLRQNKVSKLKGELESLDLEVFNNKFMPEVYLVSSIAQLKLCQFKDVKNSLDQFITKNKIWLEKINRNISIENPEKLSNDFFIEQVEKSLIVSKQEITTLQKLSKNSIATTVPAVGGQKHWNLNLSKSIIQLELLKKKRTSELRRIWINKKKILDSTIKKMRFVKIEYISLMRKFSKKVSSFSDYVSTIKAAPAKDQEIDFPFDGVMWGDEPFHLIGEVTSLCLRGN